MNLICIFIDSTLILFLTIIFHSFSSVQLSIIYMLRKIALLSLIVTLVLACNLVHNNLALIQQQPKFIKGVTNGQKYLIGDPTNPKGNYLYIANLKGTPYQMGKAFGQLFSEQIKDTLTRFYGYYGGQLQDILEKKLPTFLAKSLTGDLETLLRKVLDLNIQITKRYTNPRYYEEIKGLGDGVGSKNVAQQVKRLNLFPELIKAACTVAGVWGDATVDRQTLHVRALDWDYKNPISKNPTLIVYHPSDPKQHVHANLGWAGFIGSMTGVSEFLSLGQKVWIPPKNSVKTTRYGNPWTYMFRDILYDATDIKSALDILSNTHRTCAIHIGLGSATDHSFRMFEYAQHTLNNYDDKNYTHYGANHPKMQGIAYFDKHVQPSGDTCVGQILTHSSLYGQWNGQNLFRYLGLSHETGDTQLAVFDLENKLAYVSYSSADGTTKAFNRNPIRIDLGRWFAPF